jgi:hypothetical protein
MNSNLISAGRSLKRFGLALCLLMGTAAILSAQSVKEESSEVAELRTAVQKLRLELLQHRSDFIQWKMHWIGAELQQVRAERQRLSAERRVIEQEIAELNRFSIANSGGGENESRKEELSNARLPVIDAGERAAVERESTLVAALGTESAQMTAIQQQLKP